MSRANGEDIRSPTAPGNRADAHAELTAEQASRLAVIAVAADLENWARTASVEGLVGINDLVRVLDLMRHASAPET